MKTRVKICLCGKEFEDRTRSHNQKSCCRKCTNQRLWKESGVSGKLRMRFNNILAHGGYLNEEEKEEIIDKLLNGVCDICREKTSFRELMIDHNHMTGAYRGVLCRRCNTLLGFLEFEEDILEKAHRYLKRNRSEM